MRQFAAVFALIVAIALPASGHDHAAAEGRARGEAKVVRPPKAKPNAGQPRRRAVRKTTPAGAAANADTYAIVRGGTLVVAANLGVLVNDTDPQSRPLTAILVSSTTQGALTFAPDGSFTYVNNGSAAASDSFTYKANNGVNDTNTATVTITINNPPPIAALDSYTTPRDTVLNIAAPGVLANDTVNGAAITSYGTAGTEQTAIGSNTSTTAGSVSVTTSGSVAYTPNNGFTGQDAFKYILTNASGNSTGQVNVNVTPPLPITVDDAYTTQAGAALSVPAGTGILANDTRNSATLIAYGWTSGSEQMTIGAETTTSGNGTVRVFADGNFLYTPASGFSGADKFRYVLSNAGGLAIGEVTITVQAGDAIDFVVTSPGFFFSFSGVSGQNPTLNLQRGRTYRFRIETSSIHPFEILGAPPGSVTNNNISDGILTFAVPSSDDDYEYQCPIHIFGGSINTTQ